MSQAPELRVAQTEFEPRSARLHMSQVEGCRGAGSLAAPLDRRTDGRPEEASASSQGKGSPVREAAGLPQRLSQYSGVTVATGALYFVP